MCNMSAQKIKEVHVSFYPVADKHLACISISCIHKASSECYRNIAQRSISYETEFSKDGCHNISHLKCSSHSVMLMFLHRVVGHASSFLEPRKRPLWWAQPTGTGQWCYGTSGAEEVKHATHVHFFPLRVSTLELSHHVVRKPRPHGGATADVPAASQIHRADASRTYQLPEAKLSQPSSLSR